MIPDVDSALEALIRREALDGSRVELQFDAPTKEWVARRNAPTIDLYLYDIREDLPRREIAREDVRDPATGLVGGRRRPARRFRLSYLITAWTQRPEDEHRLLAACLATLVRHEFIPVELVGGALADAPYPVYLLVGQPPPQDRSVADVWSALGGELKPSLDLIAIAPLDPDVTAEVAAPVLEGPMLGIGSPDGASERIGSDHGRPSRRAARRLGPGDAALQEEIVQGGATGLRHPTTTDGSPTAHEAAGGRRRRTKGTRDADAEPPVAGTPPDIAGFGEGRIVRVRGISRP